MSVCSAVLAFAWLASASRPSVGSRPSVDERSRENSPLTVVTAYIEIPSKHSKAEYQGWMRGLLSYAGPMVIFVDSKNIGFMKQARRGMPSQFVPTEFADLTMNKYAGRLNQEIGWYYQTGMANQMNLDNYSIVQLEKVNFMKRAVDMKAFNSDYYSWLDSGFLRGGQQLPPTWPDAEKLKVLDDKCLLFSWRENACKPEGNPHMYTYDDPPHGVLTMGGFIGAHKKNVDKLYKLFYDKLDAVVQAKQEWAGMEQFILSHISCENTDHFDVLQSEHDPFVANDEWFWAVPYFMPASGSAVLQPATVAAGALLDATANDSSLQGLEPVVASAQEGVTISRQERSDLFGGHGPMDIALPDQEAKTGISRLMDAATVSARRIELP